MTEDEMMRLGAACGAAVQGGEVFELIGDIGAGKTTFTKGLARGMDVSDDVQSPTFTISRVYDGRDGLRLVHYDFYRLPDAGIMKDELHESVTDDQTVTVIEWSAVVAGVLPENRITLHITPGAEDGRTVRFDAPENIRQRFAEAMR